MPEDTRVIPVPEHLKGQLEDLLGPIVDEAAKVDPDAKDSQLVLESQSQKGMIGGFAGEALLYVGGVIGATFTKQWVEEVLWPRLKPKVQQYTDEILDFLLRVADPSDG